MSWNEVVMGFDYLYQEKTWKRDRRLGRETQELI